MEYYFSGTIERIIFENPSSFFRILLLDISDTDAEDFDDFEIIVTGTMADIMEGEDYTFWGELVHHPKYGEQLKISRYERAKPSSKGLVVTIINVIPSQQILTVIREQILRRHSLRS